MSRLIRTGYPVEKLPVDLRGDLPDGTLVDVRIEPSGDPAGHLGQRSPLPNLHGSEADVIDHIRRLRDED